MSRKSIVISNPARLNKISCSLSVEQDEKACIPFEDIDTIVLDHPAITLTHPVLSACAVHGIGLFSVGENHQPNGLFAPFLSFSRAVKVMRKQLSVARPVSKRLWARIIMAKIANQSKCLELSGHPCANELFTLTTRVRSGDMSNVESRASMIYFRALFGDGFKRSSPIKINSMLDFGYAILRGAITRALVGHGFLPAFGIHHDNEQNAFNLADDLIEPFRPLVDLYVKAAGDSSMQVLTTKDKAGLVELLHYDMRIDAQISSTISVIDRCITSLWQTIERSDHNLLELPTLLPLRVHQNEC